MLHYRLHCSCFSLFPSVHTSLFIFHLSSVIPHFIVHVSSHFLQSALHWSCFILFPSVHSPSHSFHLPQSISLIFTLFGCIHITWSFNLIVSFTFQPIPSLEINDLRVSLDKFLILDRYSLLEAELQWFYYSLSLYIKQELQHISWNYYGQTTLSQLLWDNSTTFPMSYWRLTDSKTTSRNHMELTIIYFPNFS